MRPLGDGEEVLSKVLYWVGPSWLNNQLGGLFGLSSTTANGKPIGSCRKMAQEMDAPLD